MLVGSVVEHGGTGPTAPGRQDGKSSDAPTDPGEAEDMARVVGVDVGRTVPSESYVAVLVTED